MKITVLNNILEANDVIAGQIRRRLDEHRVLAINLMGSPGAGKTALLEATARALGGRRELGAISGDLANERDAERLRRAGVPSIGITTGSACHLDAAMVHRALHDPPWRRIDCLFIENVGNLVCPAIYDLGQAANVVVLSVTEGEDKPLKYPVMFKVADLVLVTKKDLVPHLDVDLARLHDALARVMPRPSVIEVSARTGEGIDRWIRWLEELRAPIARGATPEGRAHALAHGHDAGHGPAHPHGHDHGHDHPHAHDHGPARGRGR